MHVTYLALRDFRSYESVELSLGPGVTTFVGPNGHGKTNLLEAISYVATLRSYRVASDQALVRLGADRAGVRVRVAHRSGADITEHTDRNTLAEIEINPGRANRARLNRTPLARPREVLGALRAVHFSPDDLALVKGDPAERRRFLDETLIARTPRYAGIRADYDRALKQRSALLKSAAAASVRGKAGKPRVGGHRGRSAAGKDPHRGDDGRELGEEADSAGSIAHSLDVWDAHLARAGAQLLAARLELVAALRSRVGRAYSALAGHAARPARMRYASTLQLQPDPEPHGEDQRSSPDQPDQPDQLETTPEVLEAALRGELSRHRGAELERGVSLVGPHRDDVALGLGDLPARGYASQGESWSLAFALRLAAYELLRGDGIEPVLLLDDVFAELDPARRDRLAELVAPAEQVLVTAANGDEVPDSLAGVRMEVADGQIRPLAPDEPAARG